MDSRACPTILVVDDDDNDVFLLEKAFKKAGHRFTRVKDGREAMAYLNGEDPFSDRDRFPYPDCLLLDLRMPILGGLLVLEWIRQSPRHKNLHVVVSSGTDHDPEVKAANQLGATHFSKPLNSSELVRFLDECSRSARQ
ncbi:MAG: response regulator [Verrucomicrobiota bacterium]